MKKITVLYLLTLFFSFIIYSCNKEKKDNPPTQGQIALSVSGFTKSASDSTSPEVTAAIITIEDAAGNIVQNSVTVNLYNMNGSYISQPISLVTGNYQLTKFLLIDQFNKVVYAAPLKSSPKANRVSNPLPLSFSVQTDSVTKVVPEVISTIGCQPEDFGYVTFGFDIASNFDFLVGTFIYNETVKNYELTTSSISVYSDTTLVYSGQISVKLNDSIGIVSPYDSTGVTTKITLPEKYNSFTLVISKPGFETYRQTFTTTELKQYFRSADKGPLVVILNKLNLTDGLVAYYPFNGNVLDYSGNNNNGTIYGTLTPTTNRNGTPASAYSFNGVDSYVEVPDAPSLNPTNQITVSAWYKPVSFVGCGFDALVAKSYTSDSYPFYQYQLGVTGDDYPNTPAHFGFAVTLNNNLVGTEGNPNSYEVGNWYYLVGTYDGDSAKLYVNAVLVNSVAQSGTMQDYGEDVYIGRMGTYNTYYQQYYYLPGSIGEIRIYNRALSQDEITELYQQ